MRKGSGADVFLLASASWFLAVGVGASPVGRVERARTQGERNRIVSTSDIDGAQAMSALRWMALKRSFVDLRSDSIWLWRYSCSGHEGNGTLIA